MKMLRAALHLVLFLTADCIGDKHGSAWPRGTPSGGEALKRLSFFVRSLPAIPAHRRVGERDHDLSHNKTQGRLHYIFGLLSNSIAKTSEKKHSTEITLYFKVLCNTFMCWSFLTGKSQNLRS
jgi:hypothetical protein